MVVVEVRIDKYNKNDNKKITCCTLANDVKSLRAPAVSGSKEEEDSVVWQWSKVFRVIDLSAICIIKYVKFEY